MAGVAVYDLSRLARNVRFMANLHHELERQQVAILAGNLPNARPDSATGRFMFHMLISAAQFQRDLDSERMKAMMARTFEDGGHRGNDPFGYRTARDADGKVVHPRTLVIVEEEAEVVRGVFRELARRPFSEVAALLNREGVRHRSARPWTSNAVKDLWRRREVYRGNVTSRRGLAVRPGRHEAILDEDLYRDAIAGVDARTHHRGPKPRSAKRLYLLRGLAFCECGTRMRGDTRVSRGKEWRYYSCPVSEGRLARVDEAGRPIVCRARRVPAGAAEAFVLAELERMVLPAGVIEAAREELRIRLCAPTPGTVDRERSRLRTRLAKLAELYSWGDLSESEYRRQRAETEDQVAQLPGGDDKLVMFDKHRSFVRGLGDSLAVAPGEKRQELVAMLVERVRTAGQQAVEVAITPPARPFFAVDGDAATAPVWRPRTDSNRRRQP